jgi:hypothetical protein
MRERLSKRSSTMAERSPALARGRTVSGVGAHREPPLRPPQRVELCRRAVFRVIGEHESCVLHLDRHTFFSANASGTFLLRLIARGTTRSALVAALRRRFILAAAAGAADVDRFLTALARAGMLAPARGSSRDDPVPRARRTARMTRRGACPMAGR